jgi:peptidoglycan/xylan/chitin deacetylase (PgdA/CDA1 family)
VTSSSPYRARSFWTASLARIARRRSLILGYHGVADCARRDDLFMLQLAPAKFRAQLEMMLAAGFEFRTVAELARAAGGGSPPPRLAAVSFDDALRNTLTTALPILRELGVRATVYVPTGWLGGHSPWIAAGAGQIMTADDLRELAQAGWELGAHTHNHADLSQLDYAACRREIDACCEVLGEIGAQQVQTLAYPFGRYGPAAIAAARDAGLLAAVTTGSGSWAPFELTRAMIGAADPFALLLLKLTDRYEPLLRTPPLRAARHASRRVRRIISGRRDGAEQPIAT